MKLHQEEDGEGNRITACGPGWIAVNGERISRPTAVGPDLLEQLEPAADSVEALLAAAEQAIERAAPQVVLLGTGDSFALAPAVWSARMAAAGIGAEAMDTPAACRTFNVLAYEGRRVVAVLGLGRLAGSGRE